MDHHVHFEAFGEVCLEVSAFVPRAALAAVLQPSAVATVFKDLIDIIFVALLVFSTLIVAALLAIAVI